MSMVYSVHTTLCQPGPRSAVVWNSRVEIQGWTTVQTTAIRPPMTYFASLPPILLHQVPNDVAQHQATLQRHELLLPKLVHQQD